MKWVAIVSLACGCVGPSAFPCQASDQCVGPGGQGFCEPLGYCSFPDPTCGSGRRFGEHVTTDRALRCTDLFSGDGGGRDGAPACKPLVGMEEIAAGREHACARAGGNVWCWGRNNLGQVGDGTSGNIRTRPTQVAGLEGATQLALGLGHSCARTADGKVSCFGDNGQGQLGNGTVGGSVSWVGEVTSLSGIDVIRAGERHVLALRSDGAVLSWGANAYGQGGFDPEGNAGTPSLVAISSVVEISAGNRHSCAMTRGGTSPAEAWCWGNNHVGELGIGSIEDKNYFGPMHVVSLPNISFIASGHETSCAITAGTEVYCWGRNDKGQLGFGPSGNNQPTPAKVLVLKDAFGISLGDKHTCAWKVDGSLWCWGDNEQSQFGQKTTSAMEPVPARLDLPFGTKQLAIGGAFSCALTLEGAVYCFGDNSYGQLGNGASGTQRALAPMATCAP